MDKDKIIGLMFIVALIVAVVINEMLKKKFRVTKADIRRHRAETYDYEYTGGCKAVLPTLISGVFFILVCLLLVWIGDFIKN